MNRKGNLLIVDDESDLRELLSDQLAHLCDEIHTATNGKEALALIDNKKVDAILSDISMPIMNGLKFLAELRFRMNATPFVVLSGYGDTENVLEALRLNANDFLEKPWDEALLAEVVSRNLQLGVATNDLDAELEATLTQLGVPADKILQVKSFRKSILQMRFASITETRSKK